MKLELDDIQGLVARGYRDLRSATFVLVGLGDGRAAAGAWLAAVAGAVTSSAGRPAATAVNVAVAASGLRRLALDDGVLAMFPAEFLEGMVGTHRSRILGDVGECAPDGWAWGGPATPPVDAVLLLYAADDAGLSALYESHARQMADRGVSEVGRLDTSDIGEVEPFGFRDGISQPIVEGLSQASGAGRGTVRAGEFVLGYPNEYGLYTSRPLVAPADDAGKDLPADPSGSGRRDLGRNGTYLVHRQLAQDVRGFWSFVDRASAAADGQSDAAARMRLAAKMVGRWPSGAPLVLAPDADDPSLATANDFGYHREDPDGLRCPIGAHLRRANPRDSLDPQPGSQKSIAIGNRHRILRRGREYGPGLDPAAALARTPIDQDAVADESERGLHFLCLNANIARQFEFIQHTWLNDPNFAGLHGEGDPIVSPMAGADFRIPAVPVRRRVTGLPRFVTVRGGGYFFLPGIRALRYLAARAGG